MYDVEEQSRVLRWSYELKSRLAARGVADVAGPPAQRSPLEDIPSTDTRWPTG